MRIKVSDQKHQIDFNLNDSNAAKDLIKQLPLTIEVKDYSDDEKIFYPQNKLTTTNTPETSAKPGTLAYFAPWGDVVMFYKAFDAYPGLYILGKVISNPDQIEKLQGKITITQL